MEINFYLSFSLSERLEFSFFSKRENFYTIYPFQTKRNHV